MSAGLPHASGPGDSGGRSFAHPSVLAAISAGESWADPQMDPTGIDWDKRQQEAWIPFQVVNGRPVNPCERTGARFGRNELGHWGEQKCTDAVVTITGRNSRRWLVMVERSDGYGWGTTWRLPQPWRGPHRCGGAGAGRRNRPDCRSEYLPTAGPAVCAGSAGQ